MKAREGGGGAWDQVAPSARPAGLLSKGWGSCLPGKPGGGGADQTRRGWGLRPVGERERGREACLDFFHRKQFTARYPQEKKKPFSVGVNDPAQINGSVGVPSHHRETRTCSS